MRGDRQVERCAGLPDRVVVRVVVYGGWLPQRVGIMIPPRSPAAATASISLTDLSMSCGTGMTATPARRSGSCEQIRRPAVLARRPWWNIRLRRRRSMPRPALNGVLATPFRSTTSASGRITGDPDVGHFLLPDLDIPGTGHAAVVADFLVPLGEELGVLVGVDVLAQSSVRRGRLVRRPRDVGGDVVGNFMLRSGQAWVSVEIRTYLSVMSLRADWELSKPIEDSLEAAKT